MKRVEVGLCPMCGSPSYKSKSQMAAEILSIVGYPESKSVYSDGNFNRNEMAAVYFYIKFGGKQKGGIK